jgi:hypothetical protein
MHHSPILEPHLHIALGDAQLASQELAQLVVWPRVDAEVVL